MFNLQRTASDAIRLDIEHLERKVKTEESRLQKQHGIQNDDDRSSNTFPNSDWTQSYATWDSWDDTEEINNRLLCNKQRVKALKAKTSKCNTCNRCHKHNQLPSCAGSQNRKAERQVLEMSMSERLQKMHDFREEGNILFKQTDYRNALALYEKSLIYFEYCFYGNTEEKKAANQQRLTCLLNAAACFMKLLHYGKCIDYCAQALEIDKHNAKALYRRSQAYRFLHKFDEAQRDINLAILTGEEDKTKVFQKEKLLLKRKMREYAVESKKVAEQ
eukprot:14259886-Ditylum_brightwellii.AAC.1